MKTLIGVNLLLLLGAAEARTSSYNGCTPPSQYFLEDKIRQSFHLDQGERELKDIVKAPKNFELREDVKSAKRSLVFATRRLEQHLLGRLKMDFEQMATNANPEEVIQDYPVKGASSMVSATDSGKLQISMENLSTEELDFLPPETLNKLERKVSIHYNYPFDSFDYYLTFDGRELPMGKAMYKMLDEFENMCARGKIENKIESEPQSGRGTSISQ